MVEKLLRDIDRISYLKVLFLAGLISVEYLIIYAKRLALYLYHGKNNESTL